MPQKRESVHSHGHDRGEEILKRRLPGDHADAVEIIRFQPDGTKWYGTVVPLLPRLRILILPWNETRESVGPVLTRSPANGPVLF